MNFENNLLIENKKSEKKMSRPNTGLRFYIPNLEAVKESKRNEVKSIEELDIDALITKEIEKSKKAKNAKMFSEDKPAPAKQNIVTEVVSKRNNESSEIIKSIDPAVIPFVELRCKNTHEVYKIAKSFLVDIETKNKKCFGFYSFLESSSDLQVLTMASCLSYLENNIQVAIIVEDINCAEFVRFRKSFSKGTIGAFNTFEWGNLTLIDYKEILSKSKNNRIDVAQISSEFKAVFVVHPRQQVLKDLKETYLDILSFVNSVSFIVNENKLTVTDLRKKESYFKSLGIPLKGIMYDKGNV